MYTNRDSISQSLPARRVEQHVISASLSDGKWRDLQHMHMFKSASLTVVNKGVPSLNIST